MEFRPRDYEAEEVASAVPRRPAPDHPLALLSSPSSQVLPCLFPPPPLSYSISFLGFRFTIFLGYHGCHNEEQQRINVETKVARLLTDTSVCQFYPTLFTLVVDVMDMLGNLVWERIKKRAEYADDRTPVCSLPELKADRKYV
ncbi:hypothetical protein GW17_00032175 [Ensete ventricosum]|nr:hypothetical protein GW17_00032175 [Ensete ventricosum]